MANRNRGRRGRSRKRRRVAPAAGNGAATGGLGHAAGERAPQRAPAPGAARTREAKRRAARRGGSGGGLSDLRALGERPQAPWHPLPLSELLILVGAIGTFFGLSKGVSHGGPPLFAGLAAVVIGTVEVTLREHLSGYRSHTLILALLGAISMHTAIVLVVAAFTRTPRALNVALLALDGALFAFLFKLLRARFLDARRERVFAGGR